MKIFKPHDNIRVKPFEEFGIEMKSRSLEDQWVLENYHPIELVGLVNSDSNSPLIFKLKSKYLGSFVLKLSNKPSEELYTLIVKVK